MNFLSVAYNSLIYIPLFNLLVVFYDTIPGKDIGIAIVALTLFTRLILYPINGKAIKSQRQLQEIQPKIKEVQDRYRDNKEKQAQELMKLYQKYKVNPFSGCLPLLIQFPILIALYSVFINGFKDASLAVLYPFVHNPGHLNSISLGFIDLSKPNFEMALIAGALQYFQTKMLMGGKKEEKKKEDADKIKSAEEKTQEFAQSMTKQMLYIMPVVTVFFAMSFPSGLALYWSTTTLFAIVQQYLIIKKSREDESKALRNN